MDKSLLRFLPLLPVTVTLAIVLALRGASLVFFISILLLIFFIFRHFRYYRTYLLILPFVFILYYTNSMTHLESLKSHYSEGKATLEGTIHTLPIIDGDFFSMMLLTTEEEKVQVRYFIATKEEKEQLSTLSPGDRCVITGQLAPFSPPTNFDQFDYRRYMHEQHIFWMLRPYVGKINCEKAPSFRYTMERWRHTQIRHLEETVDPRFSGIMIALLFGERRMMFEDVLDAYERLGVVHLLAVSGLHVGIVTTTCFYVLIRLYVTRERAYELLLFLLPLYTLMTGAAIPVIRASLMAIVVLLFLRLRLPYSPIYGIIFIYMIYLFVHPFALFHLGFQLSFLLSFALIISASKLQSVSTIKQMFAVTLLSQLFSLPLIMYNMFEFSWLSLPLNIVYIPFITMLVLPGCWIAFFLSLLLPKSLNVPLVILEFIVPSVHDFLVTIANIKGATIITGKPHELVVFLFYVIIIYGLVRFESGKKRWWIEPFLLFMLVLFLQLMHPYVDPRAKVTMIDVGQGDCFLIELPFRKEVYLIDTGGTVTFHDEKWRKRRRSFDVGKHIVTPALKAKGIGTIDRLILTHGHQDHVGGAFALSRYIQIKKVNYGIGAMDGSLERELFFHFFDEGIEWEFVIEGDKWKSGNAFFFVLSPTGSEMDVNERSIVLFADIEGVTFLFTGDIEKEGEERLVRTYRNIPIDVLKVAHHGSRTSTTDLFLDHFSPKVALISAGKDNRFGHPHDEVVERLKKRKIIVLRSEEGSVRFFIKDGKVKIEKASEMKKS